jgi:hypothetical protein
LNISSCCDGRCSGPNPIGKKRPAQKIGRARTT